MEITKRSFRAFSVAQPMKKEIDETLAKVELEKRRFLALEREQTQLKEAMERKKKELNALKLKEPENKTSLNKAAQANLVANNTDRSYQHVVNSIEQLKLGIDVHRRQIEKYKRITSKLEVDTAAAKTSNIDLQNKIKEKQNENEQLKVQVANYRDMNLKTVTEFHQTHLSLNRSTDKNKKEMQKQQVKQKSFLGEELKNSKLMQLDNSSQIKLSGSNSAENNIEVLTEAVPLAKQRIRRLIYKNKEKLKIVDNYRKFGQNLQQMFKVMKEYKGRDDINFIADQFVMKEKQLQKIQEYIGKIENRITAAKKTIQNKQQSDQMLEKEVLAKRENISDLHFSKLSEKIGPEITQLKNKEKKATEWLQKVSNALRQVTDQPLTRTNAIVQIGKIEGRVNLKNNECEKKSPTKVTPLPTITLQDQKQVYTELLDYEKMRQFASEYVKNKKAV